MFLQNSLLSILQSLHCGSTHHYFALDALPLVQTSAGKRLVRVLLRHHKRYLIGATDPDTRFRDFQNHVIHVRDGYWGGAPRMAHKWYDRLQRYLRTNRFSDAAHAAGVLSHYFTDPLQPLHTEHSDLEKVLHRPIEQSIYRAYSQIHKIWRESEMEVVFQLSNQVSWLGESMLHGSRFANRKCSMILDQYDLMSAVENPPAGLSLQAKNSLAELFGLAITGWARVLERAADEAEHDRGKKIPVQLIAPAVLTATVRGPVGLVQRQWADRREQREIVSMIEEYAHDGKLVHQIPDEVDIVHRVAGIYQSEKQWQPPTSHGETKVTVKQTRGRQQVVGEAVGEGADSPESVQLLCATDSVSAAAFLGSRVASRLVEIGIDSVADLLHCPPVDLAERMQLEHVTVQVITQLRGQASLMVNVKGLGDQAAKLLVAAGYTTAESISLAPRASLYREIKEVAGKWGSKCPQHSEINSWIALASAHTDFFQRRSA